MAKYGHPPEMKQEGERGGKGREKGRGGRAASWQGSEKGRGGRKGKEEWGTKPYS